MELLNNTVFATLIINLLSQLIILSVIGWVIVLIIKRRAAVYRSLISSLIMISLMLLTFISLGFQLMNITWSEPLLSITQKQINSSSLAPSISESTEKVSTVVTEVSEIKSANASTGITMAINCFGILWLGGFLFVLIKLCYSLIFLRRFKIATLAELDDEFMIILHEVSGVFKFRYVPQILISKAVASPVTLGITRVSVLIPENLYENMTKDEFKSILFHEFAHIHHKDHLFSILDKFIIGMNWWNPLVYHISNEQNLAREDVCDNYAIEGIKSAKVYSRCLVNLAEKVCLISNLPATAGMAGRKSGLEQRIKSILSKERKMFSTTKKTTKLTISILCVLVIVFVGGISVAFAEGKNSNKSENSKQDIRKKLKETKIDSIHFKNMKISDAVKMLSEKYGINIILNLTPQEREKEPKVDLVLKKKNLYQVVYYLCKAAKFKFRIGKNEIFMQSSSFPKKIESKQQKEKRILLKKKRVALTEKKLKKIIFPNIEFKNDSIFSVIRFLNRLSKRCDPDKVGISVIAGFSIKTADELPKVTMSFKNISMSDILRHLCQDTGLKYKVEEGAVILLGTNAVKKTLQQNSKYKLVAIKAAKSWLALVDAGKYQESWKQASQSFKGAVTKEQWGKAMTGVRKSFGINISRKLKSKRYCTSLPGAPDGKYLVIQFKASFKNKKSAIETITPMLDKDGKWRVSGYFIK
jgi:beta-lactamase regulating signal transducer with metallopeptidase domain